MDAGRKWLHQPEVGKLDSEYAECGRITNVVSNSGIVDSSFKRVFTYKFETLWSNFLKINLAQNLLEMSVAIYSTLGASCDEMVSFTSEIK